MKSGLSPGTLIHVGDNYKDKTEMILIKYNKEVYEKKYIGIEDIPYYKDLDNNHVWWLIVDNLSNIDIIEKISHRFEVNELITENILNTAQRTKIEDHKNFIFALTKRLYLNKEEEIDGEQISLIVGKNFLITYLENGMKTLDNLLLRTEEEENKLRKLGPDYLAYLVLDFIVDDYFYIIEDINLRMEDVENVIIDKPSQKALIKIHKLRKELMTIQKVIWSLREVISTFVRFDGRIIKESTTIYFKDVYEHLFHILDIIDTFMDMLAGMFDIYLSSNGNRMNEIMKILTIFSTIFMPITFIVGIYGMNFDDMPELRMKYGYPGVWLIMLTIATSMILYFKKKKWI